jgi:hypothetical protein
MSWLDDLHQRLEQEEELTPDSVCRLIAAGWGGCRIYVPKTAEKPVVLPTDTPKTLQLRYNLPRSTAHSWIVRLRKRR